MIALITVAAWVVWIIACMAFSYFLWGAMMYMTASRAQRHAGKSG